ncbi:DUF3885 domain-containing protein [Halalkalibacter krulwichiae]
MIFLIYDDSGCKVIADRKETIMPLYKKYKGWVSECK